MQEMITQVMTESCYEFFSNGEKSLNKVTREESEF